MSRVANTDADAEDDLIKVVWVLQEGDHPSYDRENLWAQRLDEHHAALRNILFIAYGCSEEDVVELNDEDPPEILRVTARSGNSTYRVFFSEAPDLESERFRELWQPLADQGCRFEGATRRLFAINVPPGADLDGVYRWLEQGEAEGVWEFEEGHCAAR